MADDQAVGPGGPADVTRTSDAVPRGEEPARRVDDVLVARAVDGDGGAFDELVLRYQDRIFNLLYRLTGSTEEAEDLAQETFLKAFRALPGFRRGSQVFTWLYRIALNAAYSQGRKGRRRREVEGVPLEAAATRDGEESEGLIGRVGKEGSEPDGRLERAGIQERVQKAIAELEEEHRTVVLLRDMEGLDYGQIAELVGASRAAVKSRLHRARLELAHKLKDLKE